MSTEGDPPDKPPEDLPAPAVPVPEAVVEAAPPAPEESILPATYDEHALQEAVGARPRKRRDKEMPLEPVDADGLPDEKKRNKKLIVVIALTVVAGGVNR